MHSVHWGCDVDTSVKTQKMERTIKAKSIVISGSSYIPLPLVPQTEIRLTSLYHLPTLQLQSFATDAQPDVFFPNSQCHWQWWSPEGSSNPGIWLRWWFLEIVTCEAKPQEHWLTTSTTPAVKTGQHALIDYAGVHLCGQAVSRHVSHLNFTGREQNPISLLQ